MVGPSVIQFPLTLSSSVIDGHESLLLDVGIEVVLLQCRESGATIILRSATALLVTEVLTCIGCK